MGSHGGMENIPAAKLLEGHPPVPHLVSGGLYVVEYHFEVPLDYQNPGAGSIELFARTASRYATSPMPLPHLPSDAHLSKSPWLVFLQGGPGFGNQEPQDMALTRFALSRGFQLLLLDYRGTGLSTPITADTLLLQGDAQKQADYLKLFRQDNIVRDLEAVRKFMLGQHDDRPNKKWSILGQSFGGFVSLTYLSKFPESLTEVYITGGLAPIASTAEEVYTATFKKVQERNEAYYKKFPEDVPRVRKIANYLHRAGGVELPAGGRLTAQRFLTLGLLFGLHGGLDMAHSTILKMASDLRRHAFLTRPTLVSFEHHMTLDSNVIYALLHEAIYCYKKGVTSDWAAQRVGETLARFQWLAPTRETFAEDCPEPLYFSGEMIFPFMLRDYGDLHRIQEAANILAAFDGWDDLYDEAQLALNTVPVYAASFINDMYVDFGLATETATKVSGCKVLATNALYHNALRVRAEDVLPALFKLRDDTID